MSTNGHILYVGGSAPPAELDLVLEGQGYKIWTAEDVREALHILEDLDFEALVVERELLDCDREQWRRVNMLHPKLPVLGIMQAQG